MISLPKTRWRRLSPLGCLYIIKKFFILFTLVIVFLGICYNGNVCKAAICFLPDCGDKTATPDTNQDAEKCKSEGYESYQNRVCHQYSIVEFCPYNSNYIKCNNKAWCTINDYTITECEPPTELFNKCPNGEEMYKECQLDLEEACMAEDPTYVSTCDAGWVIDPNDRCSLSDEFGHCCNTCPGFISKEELGDKTAVATCESCDGTKYIAADDGFNSCKGFFDCQDGCAPDANTCISFGVVKCDKCNRCEAKCSNETCPEGAICEYEACTWRYCDPIGCKIGYKNFCTPVETLKCSLLGYDTPIDSCDGMGMIICPDDPNYVYCIPDDGSCCTSLCEGYEYETIPTGYISTGSCHCCGKDMHKIAINPCEGFSDSCPYGPADGAATCVSGKTTMYKECKDCPNACPDNLICPEGYICQEDTCSHTFCPIGCATQYQNYCGIVNTDCEDLGYSMVSSDCMSAKNILRCPYDANKVFCNREEDVSCEYWCQDYPYKTIPDGYVETAQSVCCDTTYYQIEPAPCDGFHYTQEDCEFGGDTEAGTCLSGTVTKYQQCLACADACDYTACPEGTICVEEPCSHTFCPTGCAVNYVNYCTLPETDCDKLGYFFTASACVGKEQIKCPYDQNKIYCE